MFLTAFVVGWYAWNHWWSVDVYTRNQALGCVIEEAYEIETKLVGVLETMPSNTEASVRELFVAESFRAHYPITVLDIAYYDASSNVITRFTRNGKTNPIPRPRKNCVVPLKEKRADVFLAIVVHGKPQGYLFVRYELPIQLWGGMKWGNKDGEGHNHEVSEGPVKQAGR